MKSLIHIFFFTLTLLCFTGITSQCNRTRNTTTTIETVKFHAADGLNLKAVTDLVTKVKDASELEKRLNQPGNKINNLDLDENNEIDFIKVTEINKPQQKGFSLTTEIKGTDGVEEQELATIQIEKTNDNKHRVQTHGNSNIYGHNHYYHRSFLGDMLLWSYLTSSHRSYNSNYGYRHRPSYFSSRRPMAQSQYAGFHAAQPYQKSTKRNSSSFASTPLNSPNKNKTAKSIKAPLRNPTTSQKSFQTRNPSKNTIRSNGFNRSKSPSSRYGSSSSSRSRSSFGGGK